MRVKPSSEENTSRAQTESEGLERCLKVPRSTGTTAGNMDPEKDHVLMEL